MDNGRWTMEKNNFVSIVHRLLSIVRNPKKKFKKGCDEKYSMRLYLVN